MLRDVLLTLAAVMVINKSGLSLMPGSAGVMSWNWWLAVTN